MSEPIPTWALKMARDGHIGEADECYQVEPVARLLMAADRWTRLVPVAGEGQPDGVKSVTPGRAG